MDDYFKSVLEYREFNKDESFKTVTSLKSAGGNLFIDSRKFQKSFDTNEFRPRRKGLMLTIEDWKHVLPHIQELIALAEGMNGANKP